MNHSATVSHFRQRWFWIALTLLGAGCAAFSYRYFPRIFPIVSLDIRMDRAHAVTAARALATANQWGPMDGVRDVASFASEPAQQFIELEGGGKPAFASLLQDNLYSPYSWWVRLFKESETRQVYVQFKPGGEPFGFEETLRQDAPGAALAADRAREIAEAAARAAPWQLPLDRFKPVETSQETRPGGRIDHTFVYERPDRLLGEGRLRLALVVKGDRLAVLRHFVKVPEAFNRRYEDLRSTNYAIANGATVTGGLLYVLGGCVGGFLFLMRGRAVLWREPLIAACALTALRFAADLNSWPLAWMGYDTALSSTGFISERLVAIVTNNLGMGLLNYVSFLAAEGLTRRAFPQHPQFWRIWSRDAASSPEILGRTIGGYLMGGAMLAYLVVFYFFALGKLGWWLPTNNLVDPDSLAHIWPWLTPLSGAFGAGFWEETIFRAVPLAGAALLGSRFGKRNWWIAGALVLQAAVFAGAHANYANQPAYARLVELAVPALVFGLLYLRFGLLPAIVMHFAYDVVLMSLPLFAASADGIWLDRTLLILFSLLPLWLLLWQRQRSGRWVALPEQLRNGGWSPPAPRENFVELDVPLLPPAAISGRLFKGTLVAGIAGLVAMLGVPSVPVLGTSLTYDRASAIEKAEAELARQGVKLPASYGAAATVSGRSETVDRFVWRTAGRERYEALLGRYLPAARWRVRFATFEGDVAERAEEWYVFLDGEGSVGRVVHRLPQARTGATLSEADARMRVHSLLGEKWNVDPTTLQEVSATSEKHPGRVDWTFVFRDPAEKSLAPGEARLLVELAGDEPADAYRYVFVPEDWERADRALQSIFNTGAILKGAAVGMIVVPGVIFALVAWSRKRIASRPALVVFALLFVTALLESLNRWPATAAGFSTAQPLELQRIMAILNPVIVGLLISGGIALLAGSASRWMRPSPVDNCRAMVLGSSIGLMVAGGLALAHLLQVGSEPRWPSYGATESFVPLIAPALSAFMEFFALATMLLSILVALDCATNGWERHRAVAALASFVSFAVLVLPSGGESIGWWLASAALSALVLLAVYLSILRWDLTLIPMVAGVAGAANAIGDGLTGAYTGALPAALLACATHLALGWWSTLALRRMALVHRPVPGSAAGV